MPANKGDKTILILAGDGIVNALASRLSFTSPPDRGERKGEGGSSLLLNSGR